MILGLGKINHIFLLVLCFFIFMIFVNLESSYKKQGLQVRKEIVEQNENTLPKFLFVEILEQNFDTLPLQFIVKPRLIYSFDKRIGSLVIFDKSFNIDMTSIIIGHTVNFNGKGRNGPFQFLKKISSMPAIYPMLDLSGGGIVNDQVRIVNKNIIIFTFTKTGEILFKYENKKFTLRPGESKQFTNSKTQDGIKYKTIIDIINFGFIEKSRMEVKQNVHE